MSINQFQGIGRVVKDPEVKTLKGEESKAKKVTKFSVAISREHGDEADFFNVSAWGKLADLTADILKKGQLVYVVGRLQVSSKEGKTYVDLQLDKFQVLEKKSAKAEKEASSNHNESEEKVAVA